MPFYALEIEAKKRRSLTMITTDTKENVSPTGTALSPEEQSLIERLKARAAKVLADRPPLMILW